MRFSQSTRWTRRDAERQTSDCLSLGIEILIARLNTSGFRVSAGRTRENRETEMMKPLFMFVIAAILFTTVGLPTQASSHREALAVLNEPAADNTTPTRGCRTEHTTSFT